MVLTSLKLSAGSPHSAKRESSFPESSPDHFAVGEEGREVGARQSLGKTELASCPSCWHWARTIRLLRGVTIIPSIFAFACETWNLAPVMRPSERRLRSHVTKNHSTDGDHETLWSKRPSKYLINLPIHRQRRLDPQATAPSTPDMKKMLLRFHCSGVLEDDTLSYAMLMMVPSFSTVIKIRATTGMLQNFGKVLPTSYLRRDGSFLPTLVATRGTPS